MLVKPTALDADAAVQKLSDLPLLRAKSDRLLKHTDKPVTIFGVELKPIGKLVYEGTAIHCAGDLGAANGAVLLVRCYLDCCHLNFVSFYFVHCLRFVPPPPVRVKRAGFPRASDRPRGPDTGFLRPGSFLFLLLFSLNLLQAIRGDGLELAENVNQNDGFFIK